MAKVRFPLHSLSASGSVGNSVTYNKVEGQKARTIVRIVDGETITAEYPARIIEGRGIAKLKIRNKTFTTRKPAKPSGIAFPTQADRERLLSVASLIASWMVRNKISVSSTAPRGLNTDIPPAHHGYLLGRAENREIRKFPNQSTGSTVSFRRRLDAPKTGYHYIVRSLLIENYRRFEITAQHWDKVAKTSAVLWHPSGDAPFHELPEFITVPIAGIVPRTFVNMWIQLAYLVPRFELPKDWYTVGQSHSLWVNPSYPEEQNPDYPAYLEFINSYNDSAAIQSTPWISAPE